MDPTLARSLDLARSFAERTRARPAELARHLFGPQSAFAVDPARFRTAVCSRRAGKSVGAGEVLLQAGISKPKAAALYLTLTRLNAKRIVWPTLKELNRVYRLGFEANESELTLKHPGGGIIYLAGANDRTEIEKFRGLALSVCVIDEAQSFPSYLEPLVEQIIVPALIDYRGSLCLIGTPGPVPVGYFHEKATDPAWSHHTWTMFDNPHLADPKAELEQTLKRRGVTADDPSIRREFFGEWSWDPNSLVFRFDSKKNTAPSLPELEWQAVVGVDLGYDDSDAVAVLVFSDDSPVAYVAEEWAGPKQTVTQLAERLQATIARWSPLSVVMDTGGLGKKIAEEIRARHGLPIKAAQKSEKFAHIELVNDALRSGRLFVLPGSRFAEDAMLVEWDRSVPDRLKVSDRFHSDIADAVLYAFRESQHWMHEPPAAPLPRGSAAEFHAVEAEHVAAMELEIAQRKSDDAMWSSWEWNQ